MIFKEKIQILRFLFAICCCVAFLYFQNPSLLQKLSHTNIQTIFWIKSLVLVGSEIFLLGILVCALLSFSWVKYGILSLVCCSSLIFGVYYSLSHKVIEYQEFVLLYKSWGNLFDAVKMYRQEIVLASLPLLILIVGFIISPPPQ